MDPVTIRRTERDALWWLCRLKMAAIGDVFAAFAAGDVNEARALRHVYRDVTRLLDDIGWKEQQDGDAFAVTMASDALLRALLQLHERGIALISAHAHGVGDGPEELQKAVDGVTACDTLMIRLAQPVSSDDPAADELEAANVAVTVRRNERRALWHLSYQQMAAIGEIFDAFDRDDAGEALTLRNRYRDVMRLLDDIGWREEQPGEQFAITMEPDRLVRVLLRLHETAVEQIADHIDGLADQPQTLQTAAVGAAACSTLLTQLAYMRGTPAGEVSS